jgi:hypothetical protein
MDPFTTQSEGEDPDGDAEWAYALYKRIPGTGENSLIKRLLLYGMAYSPYKKLQDPDFISYRVNSLI